MPSCVTWYTRPRQWGGIFPTLSQSLNLFWCYTLGYHHVKGSVVAWTLSGQSILHSAELPLCQKMQLRVQFFFDCVPLPRGGWYECLTCAHRRRLLALGAFIRGGPCRGVGIKFQWRCRGGESIYEYLPVLEKLGGLVAKSIKNYQYDTKYLNKVA